MFWLLTAYEYVLVQYQEHRKRATNRIVAQDFSSIAGVQNQPYYRIARKFRRVKFSWFADLSLPVKILIRETIFTPLIMAIGSESVKIKLRKLSRMSFRKNFIPRNFLAIRYMVFQFFVDAGVAVPSAVERKELQQFPVVKEVLLQCQVGLTQLCIWSECGWGLGKGTNFIRKLRVYFDIPRWREQFGAYFFVHFDFAHLTNFVIQGCT